MSIRVFPLAAYFLRLVSSSFQEENRVALLRPALPYSNTDAPF